MPSYALLIVLVSALTIDPANLGMLYPGLFSPGRVN